MSVIRTIILLGISAIAGIALSILLLAVLHSYWLKIPDSGYVPAALKSRGPSSQAASRSGSADGESPVTTTTAGPRDRFLAVTGSMTLRGIATSQNSRDSWAVIDRGKQTGSVLLRIGDEPEKGLKVVDIRPDSVTLAQGELRAVVKLFRAEPEGASQTARKGAEPQPAAKRQASLQGRRTDLPDWTKEVRREGDVVIVSRDLAERIKADSNILLSSLAIRIETDEKGEAAGYRVVSVDKGSLADKMEIRAGDALLEINGYGLRTAEDLQKAYESLQGGTHFDVTVLRKGRAHTLRYEVR